MFDKLPMISDVHFEQTPERVKIVLPVARNWPLLIIYSLLMLIWLGMMIGGLVFMVRIAFSGERYAFAFALMLIVLLLILFRFGRFLWRQWTTYLSNREILFVNKEELIVRRPVSMWGNTDVYDMKYVTPPHLSQRPRAVTFDYGYRHVFVGEALSPGAQQALCDFLTTTYFPDNADDDEG